MMPCLVIKMVVVSLVAAVLEVAVEAVVAAQLQALQRGDEGLPSAHALMSPAYHQRSDALERFSAWFNSPLYESLLGCSTWTLKGCVTTRETACETLLPDGRTFLGTQAVEQMVQADVVAGRPKWAEAGVTGGKVGMPLPTRTYLWTLTLRQHSDPRKGDEWMVDQIAPEAHVMAPLASPRASGGQ